MIYWLLQHLRPAFSTGGQIIADHRTRLSGNTVEALICFQDRLREASNMLLFLIFFGIGLFTWIIKTHTNFSFFTGASYLDIIKIDSLSDIIEEPGAAWSLEIQGLSLSSDSLLLRNRSKTCPAGFLWIILSLFSNDFCIIWNWSCCRWLYAEAPCLQLQECLGKYCMLHVKWRLIPSILMLDLDILMLFVGAGMDD